MPIRPSERARYPKDWPIVTARIRARAGDRCECLGECGDSHVVPPETCAGTASTRCDAPNRQLIIRDEDRPALFAVHSPCGGCAGGDPDCARAIRVVLTVGHLDHTPEHCADENLRAWCQRCHIRYDAKHHAATARATRRAPKADRDLFEGET